MKTLIWQLCDQISACLYLIIIWRIFRFLFKKSRWELTAKWKTHFEFSLNVYNNMYKKNNKIAYIREIILLFFVYYSHKARLLLADSKAWSFREIYFIGILYILRKI